MKDTLLTKTEDTVVRLKMMGLERKEIAFRMGRSAETVSVHFKHVYEKTDTDNEIELYNWYCENVFKINIRKLLQVVFLIAILMPTMLSSNNTIQRPQRARVQQGRTTRRNEANNTDSFLFN